MSAGASTGAAFGLADERAACDGGTRRVVAATGDGGGGGGGGAAGGGATKAIMTGTGGSWFVTESNGMTTTKVMTTGCDTIAINVAPAELRRYGRSAFSRIKSNIANLPQ
jgi:hypothetical protein